MEGVEEKFDIRITDSGLVIRNKKGESLAFTATEALMLLDILKEEEKRLRQIANEASPFP